MVVHADWLISRNTLADKVIISVYTVWWLQPHKRIFIDSFTHMDSSRIHHCTVEVLIPLWTTMAHSHYPS